MEDSLSIRKIIIDSRTATVGTASEFQVQLPETLSIPQGHGLYVTDIAVSHSWRTIHGMALWVYEIRIYIFSREDVGCDDDSR